MKKVAIIIIFCLLISIFLCCCTLEKLENILGTYVLTVYTTTHYGEETIDVKAEKEMEAYLVITGKDYGYYVYKDKDTPLFCREVKLEYNKNDEDKVTTVTYNDGNSDDFNFFVNSVKDGLFKKKITLTRTHNPIDSKLSALNTGYARTMERIDDTPDLSYLNKKLGVTLNPLFFGAMKFHGLNGTFYMNYSEYSPYIYDYYDINCYDINAGTLKATRYYTLKSECESAATAVKHKEENLTVKFNRANGENSYDTLTIGTLVFNIVDGTPEYQTELTVDGINTTDTVQLFRCYNPGDDYEAAFDNDLIAYFSSSVTE